MHSAHGYFGSWATTLTMSGYDRYGAYQISGNYNSATPELAIRNYVQSSSTWNSWVKVITTANVGSYGDNLGNHTATTTLNMNYNTINHVADIIADNNYGQGLVGVYSSVRYQNVFSMGAAYRLSADGTGTGNMYGLVWTHSNIGGQSKSGLGHQLLAMSGGTTTAAMGNGFWTNYTSYMPFIYDTDNTAYYLDPNSVSITNDMRANIFYDQGNTGYYVDPASTSNVNAQTSNSLSTGIIDFRYAGSNSGQGNNAYAIFQEGGGWSHPYPDLRIAYHTGIKLGANPSYNGIRFYNDYDMSTQTMSVGDGDNNVRIYYNLLVTGNINCSKMNSTGFIEPSDIRLKTNITPIVGALDKVKAIQGVNYNWNKDLEKNKMQDDGLQYGLIAQQLEKVIPELVHTDSLGWKSVEYSHLVPVLIEALKEQQAIIEKQQLTITGSKDDISFLKQYTKELEAKINDIVNDKQVTGNK